MNQYSMSLAIPTDIKELELIYWLRPYTVDVLNTRYRINPPGSTLYLQKVVPYQTKKAMNPDEAKLLSYAITPTNLSDVKDMFEKVASWFTDESLKELYGLNDEGGLMFNMEYKDLKAICVDETSAVKTALKIVPAPVEIGNEKLEPGVVLFVNRQANAIVLRMHQIKRLCRFIHDFSFLAYDQYAMTCFQYALANQNVITQRDANQIANNQASFNTNFKKY